MPDVFRGTAIEAIPGTPLPYGLLSVATSPEVLGIHELNGVEWKPISCAEAGVTDWCADGVAEKVFTSTDVVRANPVTIYYGYQCNPIGQTGQEASDYARAGLAIGAPRAIEKWLAEKLAADAIDVTPGGGAVGPNVALGLLEGALASAYGGVGVVHVPAGAAAWMAGDGRLSLSGARYQTALGNWASLGAGYQLAAEGPGGQVAGSGQHWLYVTGPVLAIRSPDVSVYPPTVNVATNERVVLAEQTWVIGYECDSFAVLVDPCECGSGAIS